jgi:ABC-2 type transport system ATP-binding protein
LTLTSRIRLLWRGMIRVTGLSKYFGRFRAVSEVSFQVAPGEVVGLLGANGAGKTTTLRMITGFLPPDAGTISINGHDSLDASSAARRCIGYLPESAPAYGEMATEDYLRFRGRLQGMRGAGLAEGVRRAIDSCDLGEVRGRRVGHLSRGYRQRVGLAGAILHNPPVLVLDEPTSALDPRQIRQIRGLIRELARTKAVLVSSHILPEVEQTCDRVVIMARGRVLAEGTPAALIAGVRSGMPYVVEARTASPEELVRRVGAVHGIGKVDREALDDGWVRVRVEALSGAGDLREAIAAAAAQGECAVRELRREKPGLERVFLELMEEAGSQEAA